jgi:hypothetical protein
MNVFHDNWKLDIRAWWVRLQGPSYEWIQVEINHCQSFCVVFINNGLANQNGMTILDWLFKGNIFMIMT